MTLSDDARKARNEYARQYRAKNKAKVKQYAKDYWERKARSLMHPETEEAKK